MLDVFVKCWNIYSIIYSINLMACLSVLEQEEFFAGSDSVDTSTSFSSIDFEDKLRQGLAAFAAALLFPAMSEIEADACLESHDIASFLGLKAKLENQPGLGNRIGSTAVFPVAGSRTRGDGSNEETHSAKARGDRQQPYESLSIILANVIVGDIVHEIFCKNVPGRTNAWYGKASREDEFFIFGVPNRIIFAGENTTTSVGEIFRRAFLQFSGGHGGNPVDLNSRQDLRSETTTDYNITSHLIRDHHLFLSV